MNKQITDKTVQQHSETVVAGVAFTDAGPKQRLHIDILHIFTGQDDLTFGHLPCSLENITELRHVVAVGIQSIQITLDHQILPRDDLPGRRITRR